MDGMEFKTIVLPAQIYNYRALYPFSPNQNPYIEEEHNGQRKGQKDK
jgi:hypothetical protein